MNCITWTKRAPPWLGLALAALSVPARADIVLEQNVQSVLVSSTLTADYTLPSSGTLTVQLTDYAFPAALQSMNFSLFDTSSGSQLIGSMSAAGTEVFNVQAGTISTLFVAVASPATGLGMYGADLTYVPSSSQVPLPPNGGLLLLVGAAFVGALSRTRKAASGREVAPA